MSVICKPENIRNNVTIVDCLETLQLVTANAIEDHEKVYGDLGEKYLSMVQNAHHPAGFSAAYDLLIKGRDIVKGDLTKSLEIVRGCGSRECVSIDTLTFSSKDYAVSFLVTLLEHVDAVTERLQKYDAKIKDFMKNQEGGE